VWCTGQGLAIFDKSAGMWPSYAQHNSCALTLGFGTRSSGLDTPPISFCHHPANSLPGSFGRLWARRTRHDWLSGRRGIGSCRRSWPGGVTLSDQPQFPRRANIREIERYLCGAVGARIALLCALSGGIMKLPGRKFLHLAASATALSVVSRITWTQTYPAQPARIIVGWVAGRW
jgi:hypothetical protein